MSNKLVPSACEVDVLGSVAMYILARASGRPSAIVDWNNNYGEDPDKAVIFHCSNLPKDVFVAAKGEEPEMYYQEIIAGTVGKENTYGTVFGRMKAAPLTYLRVSTDDERGIMRAYTGQGELTADPLETFGGYGVVHVPSFQNLLRYICHNGFEHHVSVNLSTTAAAVREALSTYLGWEVYFHQ
jgi:L-fucose isomerase-like protein